MEAAVEVTPQQPTPVEIAAPAESMYQPTTLPEQKVGPEGTEKEVETTETPQKRESRRQRQLNRERERRITAETELRLLREERQARQQQPQQEKADDEPKRENYQHLSYEDFIDLRADWRAARTSEATTRKILEESKKVESESRAKETQSA